MYAAAHYDAPTMAPVIDFRDVVVLLGRFPALAGASATVDEGEVVLLRGPNGVGKTTFLRTCAGLNSISSGLAQVLGHDLGADRRLIRRHVGLLGHRTHLYDELTVADNLRFWASTIGVSAADAFAAAERVGLSGRLFDVEVQRTLLPAQVEVGVPPRVKVRTAAQGLDDRHAAA